MLEQDWRPTRLGEGQGREPQDGRVDTPSLPVTEPLEHVEVVSHDVHRAPLIPNPYPDRSGRRVTVWTTHDRTTLFPCRVGGSPAGVALW